MKGGAITIDPRIIKDPTNLTELPELLFNHFIEKSDISFLTTGGFGIILKLTLHVGNRSPYVSFDCDNFARPVMTLIVKISLSLLQDSENVHYTYGNNNTKIDFVKQAEFQKEINIQKDIVEKTLKYLNPISPCIVFSSVNYVNSKIIDLSLFRFFKSVYLPNKIKPEISSFNPETVIYSIIAMESMENMYSVYSLFGLHNQHFYPIYRNDNKHDPNEHMMTFNNDPIKQLYIANYVYKLIQLALIGYVHGDFHIGNVLINTPGNSTVLIDFGRAEKITPEQKNNVDVLFNLFINIKNLETLQSLIDYIFNLNHPIFQKEIGDDILSNPDVNPNSAHYIYADKELSETVEKTYGWFKNPDILQKILGNILNIYNHVTNLDRIIYTKSVELLNSTGISSNTSQIEFSSSTDFLKTLLTVCAQKDNNIFKDTVDTERQRLEEAERQRLIEAEQQRLIEAETEQQRLIEAETERQRQIQFHLVVDQTARHHIINPPTIVSFNLEVLEQIAHLYNLSQLKLFQEIKRLLILTNNDITDDIRNLIYTIGYLQKYSGQRPDFGGAVPALTTEYSLNQLTQQSKKDPNKNDNNKKIQATISKIKQIQTDMAKIFAEWRDTIYDIYTNPNKEERDAYYQEQTPFTILTHLMVCSGLFGPLKEGSMYIDVKEEENKDLYDKLNSIAAAFVTMNNGYLSMSNVKMQLMIEDAQKATITVDVNKKIEIEGPTVKVTQNSDPDKLLTETTVVRREEIAAFGGNPKRSRKRRRRRHSKKQKKCCRRKSNKRFYSKKSTKKCRKYP